MVQPSETEIRKLALAASCDVRTLKKLLRGEPVRGLAGDRARAVLEAEGLLSRRKRERVGAGS